MNGVVDRRIEELERKLRSFERELQQVRELAIRGAEEPHPPATEPARAALAPVGKAAPPTPSMAEPAPAPRRPEPVRPLVPARPPEPARPPFPVDLNSLLGAKTLAWAGGVVTILGIVFLFVLAVDRGWIGAGVRVSLGGAISALLLAAGVVLERKYGHLHAALGAAGAGIAGAYATLLAATALYDLVPRPLAMVVAAAIATVGVVLAHRWSSQLVAALGLVGAMLVPAAVAFDTGLTEIGTAFVAVVFLGTGVVGITQRWKRLLTAAALAAVPQIAALVVAERSPQPATVALAGAFALLFVLIGIGYHLRRPSLSLPGLTTGFVLISAALTFYSAWILFGERAEGLQQGLALLAAAVVYGTLAGALFPVRAYRDANALLAVLALAVGAVAVAHLLSGGTLTYVWAAEAGLLAWLARRVREVRLQLLGIAYLGLALAHALLYEARLDYLFRFSVHPGAGIVSVVALAASSAVVAILARRWTGGAVGERGVFRLLAPLLGAMRAGQRSIRVGTAGVAAVLLVYGVSLGVLALFQLGPSGQPAFEHGHVVVSALWGFAGLLVLTVSLRRRLLALKIGSLGWLAVTLVKVLAFDAVELPSADASYSFLFVALSLFLGGVALELSEHDRRIDLIAATASTAALGLSLAGVTVLLDGTQGGLALLGLAAGYAGTAYAFLPRRRDYSTLMWTVALAVAAAAETQLIGGQWLVATWAAIAAALAWAAVGVSERRLQLASVAYLVGAFVLMLEGAAPLDDFVRAQDHPGAGVPSVLAIGLAAAALGIAFRRGSSAGSDRLDILLEWLQGRLRTLSFWSAGAVALYGLSLSILELFELIGPGTRESSFQSGHTAVSATWGLLGLVLLYLGLRRGMRSLHLGGFALFGLSLGKLFLYDLAQLSSITRALSFLAVGAVLLLAGFFYQRLTSTGDRGAKRTDVVA